MLGQMSVLGKTYSITDAELHLPALYETRLLYLRVSAESEGGFGVWEVDLTRLEGLNELDGKRIHIRWEGDAFEDDTLGTDNIGVDDVTDWNCVRVEGEGYRYRELQVDFARVQDRQYRVEIHFTLIADDEDPSRDITGTADVMVIADEQDPFADSR